MHTDKRLPAFELAEPLADWCSQLDYESVPTAQLCMAKKLMLDTLAVGWAGSAAEGVPVIQALYCDASERGASRIWATPRSLPAPAAALVNGLAAAALDFDSLHFATSIHADIVVTPALLAVAESRGIPGRRLLTAHVAGHELFARLGRAVEKRPGWFYSSVFGPIVAAAAVGVLLGFDARKIRMAMGIAFSRAAGSVQCLIERSDSKKLQAAFAARDGVEAALLAEAGVGGPLNVFNGVAGFEKLYVTLDNAVAADGLGDHYYSTDHAFKVYPSCYCNHAAISAIDSLVARHGVTAHDVERVTVRAPRFVTELVGSPFQPRQNPQVDAQFSVQYSVANALARGGLSVHDIAPSAVLAPQLHELSTRVEVETDETPDNLFFPVTVTIHTRAGERLVTTVTRIPGLPDTPLNDAALRDKAYACFTSGIAPLSPAEADALIGRLARLQQLDNARALWIDL